MSRNDYERLAKGFKSARQGLIDLKYWTEGEQRGFAHAVLATSEILEGNNSRFNKEKFIQACGGFS
jgi:hypothetical protein